jgi:hypothetical protein
MRCFVNQYHYILLSDKYCYFFLFFHSFFTSHFSNEEMKLFFACNIVKKKKIICSSLPFTSIYIREEI